MVATCHRPRQNNSDCVYSPTEPATREIPTTLKEVKFTAGLKFNESGGLELIIDPALPAYVGTPTPEMDALWHELTESRSIH
jgi:hypothetical protein